MKYMGSKRSIRCNILPFILKNRTQDQWYIEPFVGAGNCIEAVPGNKRIGADVNKALINLLKAIQNGFIPPNNISEQEYQNIKKLKNISDPLYAFVGFGCSFGGKLWGGYAKRGQSEKGKARNYCSESKKALLKQKPKLQTVKFYYCSYNKLLIPANSVIYCDPPYNNTESYKICTFDSDKFWEWCRNKSNEGHHLFISEYKSPEDFCCIWDKKVKTTMSKNKSKNSTEKLFVYPNKANEQLIYSYNHKKKQKYFF